ncbi:MAG: DUF1343 domain-containing protein [Polyangiaceae bacterium]|nr:DUF1343 domain-containing protein [Polyangiaceae bacterium]
MPSGRIALVLMMFATACTRDGGGKSGPAPTATASAALPPADAGEDALRVEASDAGPSMGTVAASLAEVDRQQFAAGANAAIARSEVPGAVALMVRGDQVVLHEAYGQRAVRPAPTRMTTDTVFDLASLTKPIATATTVVLLAEAGLFSLRDPVARYLPAFAAAGKGEVTIEQLLLHTSGLPADNALSAYGGTRDEAVRRILEMKTERAPGEGFRYSDLGYVVLGELVAKVTKSSLADAARSRVFTPLGMTDTGFLPGPELRARAAPTERTSPDAERFFTGEVHDPRARALGGVAGHAGLFATSLDLSRFVRAILQGGKVDGQQALPARVVETLLAPRPIPGGTRAYLGSMHGTAVAHTGFTGTSFWIDPAHGFGLVILASRLHPTGKGSADRLRSDLISAAIVAASRKEAAVRPGIDVLEETGFAAVRGRKVALLTHAAGRTKDGRRTVDVLRGAHDVKVVALLSPEHGLASAAEGAVQDGTDAASGLPLHSLYGDARRPTQAMLHGADTVVIDLQDAGARFYTYATTVGYTLEAAAELHVRVVLLDRPNPAGGEIVEGPLRDADKESFIAYHRIPVRHGMTLGELARMFVAERKLGTDVVVVPARGLGRNALYAETSLSWVAPSPNLPTPSAALLYSGVALLEATNVSVGRGTDAPFEQIGAPWIDSAALLAALAHESHPGIALRAVTFTPTTSVHAKTECHGVAFAVTAPHDVRAVHLGVALAFALRKVFPARFSPQGVATLLGHRAAFDALTSGASVTAIEDTYRGDPAAFLQRRAPYLLY